MGDSGMGVLPSSRAFVTSSSFLSFDIHVPLDGWLAPTVGLASAEGQASVEGLTSAVRLDSLVSDDIASASMHLG